MPPRVAVQRVQVRLRPSGLDGRDGLLLKGETRTDPSDRSATEQDEIAGAGEGRTGRYPRAWPPRTSASVPPRICQKCGQNASSAGASLCTLLTPAAPSAPPPGVAEQAARGGRQAGDTQHSTQQRHSYGSCTEELHRDCTRARLPTFAPVRGRSKGSGGGRAVGSRRPTFVCHLIGNSLGLVLLERTRCGTRERKDLRAGVEDERVSVVERRNAAGHLRSAAHHSPPQRRFTSGACRHRRATQQRTS